MVAAYWWRDYPNWGDRLAPHLLRHFAHFHDIEWASMHDADVFTIGSILEHIPPEQEGFVLGSGRLNLKRDLTLNPNLHIMGLRGPLSAQYWPHGDIVIGDPGLLADELVGPQSRTYDLGIVPHWSDKELAHDTRFVGHKWSTIVINPKDDPLTVVKQIGSCHKIVSSSLHGLIVADAFGIPRRFEQTERFDKEGGLFKFEDYSASIGAPFAVGELIRANIHMVGDRKDALWDAYRELGTTMRRYDKKSKGTKRRWNFSPGSVSS
jgi:pyruvyltransferase